MCSCLLTIDTSSKWLCVHGLGLTIDTSSKWLCVHVASKLYQCHSPYNNVEVGTMPSIQYNYMQSYVICFSTLNIQWPTLLWSQTVRGGAHGLV